MDIKRGCHHLVICNDSHFAVFSSPGNLFGIQIAHCSTSSLDSCAMVCVEQQLTTAEISAIRIKSFLKAQEDLFPTERICEGKSEHRKHDKCW